MARSHCKESSARSHCKESLQGVKASCKCKESSAILARGRRGSADDTTRKSTLCGDRRGRGAKTHGFLRFLKFPRDLLRGSAWSRCKNPWFFFAISAVLARPSAGIGVVEVQKLEVFAMFNLLARPSAGIGVVEVQKPMVFLRFLKFPRDPLRGSAWSRCKNSRFFAMFNLLARPSAGIGVVEVQKLEVFCDFCGARATLCGNRRGGGAKTRGFCDFCCSNWSSGVVSWFARLLPEPAGRGFDSSLVRGRASQDATCILKQLAQSNLRRASCTEQLACADQLAPTSLRRAPCLEQLAQRNLRRATCTEQLAQSSLHRATCRERNLHRATCREPLAGTNLPEQLARSNLRRPTCTDQFAQSTLPGAVSRLLHECFV